MGTVSVRVSDHVSEEIKLFGEDEKLEQTSEAARKLLAIGLETWKRRKALEMLAKGKTTLLKAAENAEMNVWEFIDLVKEEGITWIKNHEFIKKDLQRALR